MTPNDPRSNAYSWVDNDYDGMLDTFSVDRLKRSVAEVRNEHSARLLQRSRLTEQTRSQLPVRFVKAVQSE
jgi:hypothetical protein